MDADSPVEKYPVIWSPGQAQRESSQMAAFMRQQARERGLGLHDYDALWQWSVDQPGDFWSALWRTAGVIGQAGGECVLRNGDAMPGAEWFPGARLNFAENLLRYRDARPALIACDETGPRQTVDYATLYGRAARLAAWMRQQGIGVGDRVAALLPNGPEAVIGMLGAAWVGATWSSCSPDFGVEGVLDRFGQIEPVLFIAADGYTFKGKHMDLGAKVAAVWAGLRPTCARCLLVGSATHRGLGGAVSWSAVMAADATPPAFVRLPFDHPLYILYSSGTTGRPKCIVHGAGGTLLQHLKEHRLHLDLRREDRLFYFTTCGWMMWNWLASGLATGATLVLFDGNPFSPTPDHLWRLADELDISVFGTSAKYISAQEKAGVSVSGRLPLRGLRAVLSTGSPLAPESYDYLHEQIRPGIQISSISGGTDIVSCFALGCPLLPVRRGQLQCRGLGMAVEVFGPQGESLVDEAGELVCTRPFPCMPTGFWNDPDGARFRAAYFERYPGVWTHGDWTILTSEGGLVIEGRSDTVLNPGGVRIGTAEIYRQVERLPEIRECVCVGQRWDDDVRVVLFVVPAEGYTLDDALRRRICEVLRERASPRHVPAKILAVGDIPRTRNGKISELAVRDTLEGRPLGNTEALANPQVLGQYRGRAELSEA